MQNFLVEDIFFRIIIAILLGALIGAERTFAGKYAGIRTFALVSFSSAMFVIVSSLLNEPYLGKLSFDPSRVLAAIVTGIGFLGAGVIFIKKDVLKGLTTAASFWATAAIGASVGAGYIHIAVFATISVLFIFIVLWSIEVRFKEFAKKYQRARIEKLSDNY